MGTRELLLGCGHSRSKILAVEERPSPRWECLTTLDFNEECKPDVVWDLNNLPLPFFESTFDEIHAYEVLEHCGRQGDWKFFFDQFTDLHRILKPRGYIMGSTPRWDRIWAWGDPSHTRVINEGTLSFLDQRAYAQEQERGSPMTDYRFYWKKSFEMRWSQNLDHTQGNRFFFILQKVD